GVVGHNQVFARGVGCAIPATAVSDGRYPLPDTDHCRAGQSRRTRQKPESGECSPPRSRGEVEPHDFYLEGEAGEGLRLYDAMMLSERGHERRDIMATTGQQMHPVAHWPLGLGVLRRLEVAPVLDRLIPPPPAHGLSCGRGGDALGLAMRAGPHALSKVG